MKSAYPSPPWYHLQFRLPVPRSVAGVWIFAIGLILLVMLGVQMLSGIVLAMFYVPTAGSAFDSIVHILRAVRHGELVRNLHAIGASLFSSPVICIFSGQCITTSTANPI
ncbi:intron-encoded DNA endonuclease I-AniI domain protein [Shigella flexneri 1235-66]|nr:intron-encoded DNA endonuclease I-AniI domain protein [Shigella flexneri 1235-66]